VSGAAGRPWRRVGRAAAFALSVAALLLAVRLLAAAVVAHELGREAGHELAALRAGDPLWRWPLRQSGDVVAGRAFGAAELRRDGEALAVRSRDGSPFELGLPLARPADARHWPRLYLHADSAAAGTLELLASRDDGPPAARQAGQAPVCRSEPRPLPAGRPVELDLRQLHWQANDGSGTACPAPARLDYLFRLRIRLPAGTTLKLHSAELRAVVPPLLPADGDALPLPAPRRQALAALASAATPHPWPAVPLLRLPPAGLVSAEDLLALRDAARRLAPAALLLPAGTSPAAQRPSGRRPPWIDWALCAAYALALLALARRAPSARPPWLDLAAILAGPLWLIAGLHLGRPGAAPMYAAFAAGLLYAWYAQEGATDAPAWHWLGRSWRDWLLPWLPLPAAAALVIGQGHALVRPLPAHALVYVAWAALQQWLVLAVLLRRLEPYLPRAAAVPAVAALFALLHLPNGMLMQLCLLAELAWAACFLRSRALLPIALAHAGCALLAEAGLTGGLLRSLEVSGRFFL
jgi:hypothetical protein